MNTLVEVPSWIVAQFELWDKADSVAKEVVHSVTVEGDFVDSEGDPLYVEVEFCSGRPVWWATINVFAEGELISQSEEFTEILGLQEFFCTDPVDDEKTVEIRFEMVECIQTHQLDLAETLRLMKGLARMPLTEEAEKEDNYNAEESMDAFIDHARRLVYPYRVKARRA